MKKNEIVYYSHVILNNIINLHGLNNKKNDPKLQIGIIRDDSQSYDGEYSWETNTITINHQRMSSMQRLIRTLLHEYKHYTQTQSWYTRYAQKYDYDDHPYEIAAWDFEDLYWKEIQQSLILN